MTGFCNIVDDSALSFRIAPTFSCFKCNNSELDEDVLNFMVLLNNFQLAISKKTRSVGR